MKVLALVSDRMIPTVNATRVRNFFLWPAIQNLDIDLKLLGIDRMPYLEERRAPDSIPSDFFAYKRNNFFSRALHSFLYSYHQWPYSYELAQKVLTISREWQPDIIHAEELRMAAYLPLFSNNKTTAKQSVTIHNMESDWLLKTGSTAIPIIKPIIEKIHYMNLKQFEQKIFSTADLCFAYSPIEMQRYQDLYSTGNWSLTKGGAAVKQKKINSQINNQNILLTGTLSYWPNIEGIHWFIDFVLPKLGSNIGITIAGSQIDTKLLQKLNSKKIRFIDTPNDLTPIYNEHAICIVPLLSGSGTRGRILEALSHTRAVVTTTIGAEGLEFREREGIIRADTPEYFAEKIHYLVQNQDEKKSIAESGYKKILDFYDWDIVAKELIQDWKNL